jgi:hypothetical protein
MLGTFAAHISKGRFYMTLNNDYAAEDIPLSSGPNVPFKIPISCTDYALYYAKIGWHVFPVVTGTKVPFKDSGGHREATSDPELVRTMWERSPEAGIGIVPYLSGLVVLDFDNRNGGQDVLAFLQELLKVQVFDTPTVKTYGGQHFYFKDTGLDFIANVTLTSTMGADIFGRYEGMKSGYVVAPPSMHPKQVSYQWQAGRAPWELELKPFTVDLVEALNEYAAQHSSVKNRSKDFDLRLARPTESILGALDEDDENLEGLRDHDRNPRFVKAVCDLLKIPFTPEKAFSSPLRKDANPSASICLRPDGSYRYHDFTEPGKYYALAQLFGAVVTGKSKPLPTLSSTSFATWQTRLLLELGWEEVPVPVSLPPLPMGAPKSAREVYEGFRLLLICRSVFYGKVVPAPYSYSFAAQWTGLAIKDATAGVIWLKRNGYIILEDTMKPKKGRLTGLFVAPNYEGNDIT